MRRIARCCPLIRPAGRHPTTARRLRGRPAPRAPVLPPKMGEGVLGFSAGGVQTLGSAGAAASASARTCESSQAAQLGLRRLWAPGGAAQAEHPHASPPGAGGNREPPPGRASHAGG